MFALLVWDDSVTIHVAISSDGSNVEDIDIGGPAIIVFSGFDFSQLNIW
jgi:hypothetical protein